MQKNSWQRIILGIVLFCFAWVFLVGAVGAPQTALAQGPVTPLPLPTAEVPGTVPSLGGAATVQNRVEFTTGGAILASASIGLINAIQLFAQTIAYDLATGLASGCRGQKACAFTKDPGTYFTAVAYGAAGEFIGNLAQPWEELGFSLCNPRIPDIGLSIALGLAEKFQRPKPKCDFVKTINNWKKTVGEARDPHKLLKHASLAFEPGNTDLGQAFKAQEQFRIHLAKKKEDADAKRREPGGIIPQSGIISGNVTTPTAVISAKFQGLANKGEGETIKTGDVVGATLGNGAVWSAVGTTVLSTFVNTLASRLLKSALKGLLGETQNPLPDLTSAIGGAFKAGEELRGAGLSPLANSLLTPQIRVSDGAFDYVTELATCPDSGRSQFNCTVDRKFQAALEQAQAGTPVTVAQAVEKGYLNPGAPFGFISFGSGDNPPQEPEVNSGYGYSALKRLRLLRVIPDGWEFAALKIKNRGRGATLKDVLDGWGQTGPDGKCGTTDDSSNFCGLVDPNWVLKTPPATCGALVNGPTLDSSLSGRQEVCADLKHCVAEDGRGGCQAWGYCTREKNTWRMDVDPCDSQYASCDSFKPAEGATVSLLENTVDFGACTADNAGCTAYAEQGVFGASGSVTWNATAPRLYLDRDAAKCEQKNAGCTEFIASASANLVYNPGFEKDDDDNRIPDGWILVGTGQREAGAISPPVDNSDSVLTEGIITTISIEPRLSYVFSYSGRGKAVSAHLELRVSPNGLVIADSAIVSNCRINEALGLQFIPEESAEAQGNSSTYVRRSCAFTAPAEATVLRIRFTGLSEQTFGDAWVDDVQVEAGLRATTYHEGYPANAQKVYYKIAPDYVGCTGEETPEQAAAKGCDGQTYARLCRNAEVGCERYTPAWSVSGSGVSASTDPEINGIINELDRCPQKCAGYDSYLKLGSAFEPKFVNTVLQGGMRTADYGRLWIAVDNHEEDLYPLIAGQAQECSAQYAGCDEFTNLNTEQKSYFTALRACQKPTTDSQTYFTWEGSDTSGYQLKTWSFKRSNAGALFGDVSGQGQGNTIVHPPCTNYRITDASGVVQVDCLDEPEGGDDQPATVPQADCNVDTDSNAAERADCRGFYDATGNIFYRKMSRTIVSTDECQVLRWTGLTQLPEVLPRTSENRDQLRLRLEEAACRVSHGYWNPAVKQCLYLGAPALSSACPAQANGCRGFQGNTGGNITTVFSEGFDPISMPLEARRWSAVGGLSQLAYSGEALTYGQHSLKAAGAGAGEGVSRDLAETVVGANTTPAQINNGSTYFVNFLIKGTVARELEIKLGNQSFGKVTLTPEWHALTLGPLTYTSGTTALKFLNPAGADITFFVDEVTLKEVRNTVYLTKYSLKASVDPSCNVLPASAGGGYLRGAMLGCRAYTTREGGTEYLKSFSGLCRSESVGCQGLIDTRNSDSPFSEQFNATNTGTCRGNPGLCSLPGAAADADRDGTVEPTALINNGSTSGGDAVCIVPAGGTSCTYGPGINNADGTATARNLRVDDHQILGDVSRYIVVDPKVSCGVSDKGCQAVGNLEGVTPVTTWLQNDPEKYGTTLCAAEARGCETWTRSDNSAAYFKAPSLEQCVYRSNVVIGQDQYSGWFRSTPQPVSNAALVNTKEKCSGYGIWDFDLEQCKNAQGNVLTEGGAQNKCGGVNCDANLCTKGAGGTWDAGTGVCQSVAPCDGIVDAYDALLGPEVYPQLRVNVAQTYFSAPKNFGIWRNGDVKFTGRAGQCPADQATCTALVDPTDLSEGNAGKSYYAKDNARLTDAKGECQGLVSRAKGCVLLKDSANPENIWSAGQTYHASDANFGKLVSPINLPGEACVGGGADGRSCIADNDDGECTVSTTEVERCGCAQAGGICRSQNNANIILQVQRDRECAQWYQCSSAEFQWNNQEHRYKTSCTDLGRCGSAVTNLNESGSIDSCGLWVQRPLLSAPPQVDKESCTAHEWNWDHLTRTCAIPSQDACKDLGGIWQTVSPDSGRCELGVLKAATYLLRDRTFSGQEYTGYSIPNLFGLDKIQEVNIGTVQDPKYRLAYVIAGSSCTVHPGRGNNSDGCPGAQQCTITGKCAQAFDNSLGTWSGALLNDARFCRGYPEKNSPFPNTSTVNTGLQFQNVPKCNTAGDTQEAGVNCECDYKKVQYGAETRYYPLTGSPPEFITDSQGTEQRPTVGEQTVTGWYGYCLEEDPSWQVNGINSQHACLTWWPLDRLPSVQDMNNLHVEASYTVGNVTGLGTAYGAYYCLLGGAVQSEGLLGSPKAFQTAEREASTAESAQVRHVFPNAGFMGYPTANNMLVWTNRPTGPSRQIHRYDIKEVRIKIARYGVGSGPASGVYSFKPGDQNADVAVVSDLEHVQVTPYTSGVSLGLGGRTSTVGTGFHAYDFSIPDLSANPDVESEWWWWGGDDNFSDGDDDSNNDGASLHRRSDQPSNPISEVFMKPERFLATSGESAVGNEDRAFRSVAYHYSENCDDWLTGDDTSDEAYDGVYVGLHFNPENQLLDYIRFGECTAANDGVAGVIEQIEIVKHPHCDYLAKIDDNLASSRSAPNTEKLWADCADTNDLGKCYVRISADSWLYRRNDALDSNRVTNVGPIGLAPFGSASVSKGIDPRNSEHPWFLNHNRMEPDPFVYNAQDPLRAPFAGYPYGCMGENPQEDCTVNSRLTLDDTEITSGVQKPLGNNAPRTIDEVIQGSVRGGDALFKWLFAKSYQIFKWNGHKYVVDPSISWDERLSLGGGTRVTPIFTAVVENGSENPTMASSIGGVTPALTVNGQYVSGALVQGARGAFVANAKFWLQGNDKHMPIKTITVDWGDGEQTIGQGLYLNALPACDGSSFGKTTGDTLGACQTKPYSYEHLYTCSGRDDAYWVAGGGATGCPSVDMAAQFGGCCVFVPKVQAIDNWGFCNGECAGDDRKCLDSECQTPGSGDNPWDAFSGKIVISP